MRAVASHLGVPLRGAAAALAAAADGSGHRPLPAGWAVGPATVGFLYEQAQARERRRAGGVYYTPPEVAGRVTAWALEGCTGGALVVDLACGGGVFLLAAADLLRQRGGRPAAIVAEQLHGVDIDPLAAEVSAASLSLWAALHRDPTDARPAIVAGDALTPKVGGLARPGAGFDAAIGNPPFLGQLASRTARPPAASRRLAALFGDAAKGYVDTAMLFALQACRVTRAGGAVALLLPESVLSAAGARAARSALLRAAGLEQLWLAGGSVFDASVRVCVPVLRVGATTGATVRRHGANGDGPDDAALDRAALDRSWASLAAGALGVPPITGAAAAAAGTVGSIATATADFRDQYYGLIPFVRERDGVPLVTTGVVDPAVCRWGQRPVRYAKRRWEAPAVDLERLAAESDLGGWAASRLVPKVLVATQTRVLEAVVDAGGSWLPSTPVISVVPRDPAQIWHVAAVLLSPIATAWALHHAAGAALSSHAIKLSARQVLEIPAPPCSARWDAAAALVQQAHEASGALRRSDLLVAAAEAMVAAFGLPSDDPLLPWWRARLPLSE